MQDRISTLWDPTVEARADMKGANASATGRIEGFRQGVVFFQEFPLTGVGIGNFADYRGIHGDGEPLNAHNLPGELLGELGFLGTAAFVAFFLVHYLSVRKLLRFGREYDRLTGNQMYWLLGVALYDGMLLLAFSGLSGHTLQQYQWYFYPSFAITSLYFVRQEIAAARIRASEAVLYDSSLEPA